MAKQKRYFSEMVLQEHKRFRNVHIVLLQKNLSKGTFLEQLRNWDSSKSHRVPRALCWPEPPFSSPSLFQATAPTVEGLPFSPHSFCDRLVAVLSTAVQQRQRGCFRKTTEQFCNKPSKQVRPRRSRKGNTSAFPLHSSHGHVVISKVLC